MEELRPFQGVVLAKSKVVVEGNDTMTERGYGYEIAIGACNDVVPVRYNRAY